MTARRWPRNTGIAALVPDICSPLTIGDGRWLGDANTYGPTRSFNGTLDEVAVYTNALTPDRVLQHYVAATTVAASSYVQAVQADRPLLYYRMDAPGYVTPDPGTYPTAVNYGSAPVNGVYPGGVVPGGVPGPSILGLGTSLAAPINGVISCIDAGNDPAFNPTNNEPFSAMLWFKCYPADGRVQTLMSHGANNWAMNLDGTTGQIVWNLYNGGNIISANILNDGNWHMAAGVCDGANSYLYVDGTLNASGAAAGGLAGEPSADLFLGGNADFTGVGVNQRYFAGALAQAAYFTNALTAAQISHLYSVATVLGNPHHQPGAFGEQSDHYLHRHAAVLDECGRPIHTGRGREFALPGAANRCAAVLSGAQSVTQTCTKALNWRIRL